MRKREFADYLQDIYDSIMEDEMPYTDGDLKNKVLEIYYLSRVQIGEFLKNFEEAE